MRILLTGASGFIGRPTVELLRRENDVWTIGRDAREASHAARALQWDLRESLPVDRLPPRLDAVVHLAQSREYRRFPDNALEIARINVGATLELLDYALAAGVRSFVFASSGGIYGGADHPLNEDERITSPDFYLATKVAAEALAESYRSEFDVVALRLFFVYGRGQSADRFFAKLVRCVINGDAVDLYGAEGLRLNPVHVSDVAAAIAAALSLKSSRAINVAGPEVLTLRTIAELIGSRVGRAPLFSQQPADRQRDLVADISLMRRFLVEPRQRLVDRIGEVCEEIITAAK